MKGVSSALGQLAARMQRPAYYRVGWWHIQERDDTGGKAYSANRPLRHVGLGELAIQ